MKKLLCTIAALMITASAFGQGTVQFGNRLPANLGGDQRIYLGGTSQLHGDALNSMGLPGPGSAYTVGLFLANSAIDASPLALVGGGSAALAMRQNASGSANFFLDTVEMALQGLTPGTEQTFVLRGWANAAGSYAAARNSTTFAAGESNPITVQLGGNPPGGGLPITSKYLEGLQEFNLYVVPEPSTIALGVLGAAALLLRRRK